MAANDVTTYENNIEYAPFNSINKDRSLNANHLSRWLSSVNSDGVTKKFNQFKITISSGMNVVIDTGIGFVDGHHIYLKSSQTIPITASSTAGDRIDTIGYRLEVANRKVVLYYKEGEVGSEEAPDVLDDNNYIEVPLYNINVRQSTSSILTTDIIDVRQYVVSSATYFKKYPQLYKTTSTISELTITVPFNADIDQVDVLINGIALLNTQYSIEAPNKIKFNTYIPAGNEIQIQVWHFQDGSGSIDSLDKVLSELKVVNSVVKYYYQCTGNNDNLTLSQLAQDFLNATGDFSGISATAQLEIIVCGEMGTVSQYYSGDGTQSRPYTYFAFGRGASQTRTIYFNFANCARIDVSCPTNANSYSTIFSGSDINVRNVALNVGSGYNVDIFNGQNIHCQDSEFWMSTTGDCCVGRCCGYFENVRTSITSTAGNAFGFYGNGRLTRVIGGTHFAWTAGTSKEAVCFYVEAYQTENVLHVTMANMPEYSRSGYTQSRPVKINHGYATFFQNTMWMAATVDNDSFYSATNCTAYGNVILSKN